MRPPARALETRTVSVDPPPATVRSFAPTAGEPPTRRNVRSDAAPLPCRRRRRLPPSTGSQPSFGREESLPHARQDRQASSVSRPLEGRQRPKKPGPSLLQVASPVWRGSPVRLRLPVFSGRLTGLLSRSPPTDTRPQARAYWAICLFGRIAVMRKGFFRSAQIIFGGCHKSVRNIPIWEASQGVPGMIGAAGAGNRRQSKRASPASPERRATAAGGSWNAA